MSQYNYLDYDNKGWSNNSGYGNLVITRLPQPSQSHSDITPWNRLQALKPPYHIENTQYAWTPPLTAKNERELYQTCLKCDCNGCEQQKS